jgi:glycosyltransferase involved in cell wall biosynthesis
MKERQDTQIHKSPKRVLIVLYYWPPSGGPGVQRWLKFVKYLPEFGITPTVFVPQNPHYPQVDKSLELEIPKDLEIIKSKISEPYKISNLFSKNKTKTLSKGIITEKKNQSLLQRFLLYVRGNFFIPDARKSWIKPSVKKITKLIKTRQFDALITTGPPHSLHMIGYLLKQKNKDLNWIVDFRDPWTTIGYHKQLKLSKSSQAKHLKLEKNVLNSADHILVTSPSTKTEFETKTKQPITLITNGFDDVKIERELDELFSITHVGTLLNERNPLLLWKAITELIEEETDFKHHLEIKLVGHVGNAIVDSLNENHLLKHTTLVGYVPHLKSQEYMFNAQLLLLIEKDQKETKSIIPGKLFEYFLAERPILAIGPKAWDVKTLIEEHQTGETFEYNDYNAIKESIRSSYHKFLKGKLELKNTSSQQFHRKTLTEELSKIIHQL